MMQHSASMMSARVTGLPDVVDRFEEILSKRFDVNDWRTNLAIVRGTDGEHIPLEAGIEALLKAGIFSGFFIDSTTEQIAVEFAEDGSFTLIADNTNSVTVEPIADEMDRAFRRHLPLTPVTVQAALIMIVAPDTLEGLMVSQMRGEYDQIGEELGVKWRKLREIQEIEGRPIKQALIEKAELLSKYGRIEF